VKLDIDRRNDKKIFLLPTTIILEGQMSNKNESLSTSSFTEEITNDELLANNVGNNMNRTTSNDLTLSYKSIWYRIMSRIITFKNIY
jgi:hypothetical protein